jgi:ketosteroid isomerase-like protein
MSPITPEEMARSAYAQLAIMKTLSKLAHAQDNHDVDAYAACFTDMIVIDQPMVPGWKPVRMAAREWANIGVPRLARFDATHHRLFNHVIDIEGDEATCIVDVSAMHILTVDGEKRTWSVGGRYHLRLARQSNGEWLISERALRIRYQLGDETLIDRVNAPDAKTKETSCTA